MFYLLQKSLTKTKKDIKKQSIFLFKRLDEIRLSIC